MKNINLKNCGLVELNKNEVEIINGGNELMDMIQAMWDATPSGGSSYWENKGDGFTGTASNGCKYTWDFRQMWNINC